MFVRRRSEDGCQKSEVSGQTTDSSYNNPPESDDTKIEMILRENSCWEVGIKGKAGKSAKYEVVLAGNRLNKDGHPPQRWRAGKEPRRNRGGTQRSRSRNPKSVTFADSLL